MLYIYILNLKIWEDVIIEKSFKMFEQGTHTHKKNNLFNSTTKNSSNMIKICYIKLDF